MCKSKLHRVRVTEAHLDYMGSVSIDEELMRAADILPYEMVQITNMANATLWQTYAMPVSAGSGTIGLNGPPARLFQPGDEVVILSFAMCSDEEAKELKPRVVFVDERNHILAVSEHEVAGPTLSVDG